MGLPRRRRPILFAVAGLLAVGAVGWFVVWPAVELESAESELRRHDPAAARDALHKYLSHHPSSERALFLAVQANRRADAHAEAERLLAQFEDRFGSTDASQREWLLLGVQQGDFGGDESRLRPLAEKGALEAEALAKGYAAVFRHREAIETCSRLLEREANHISARLLRGSLLDQLRQTDAAEADFRKAVEQSPSHLGAHELLAGFLGRHGHTREAIAHFELVLKSRPNDTSARLGLARVLVDAAEIDEAERHLDTLIVVEPEHVEALVEHARLDLRRGKSAEAQHRLEQAIRAAPWHREAHKLLLVALTDQGRTEAAAQCEKRIAALTVEDGTGGALKLRARDNPGDVEVRWELWQWSTRNGQTEEGLAWLFEMLRAQPEETRAHAALAEYFERAGQPRRSAWHRKVKAP